jgi:hypothetical protein
MTPKQEAKFREFCQKFIRAKTARYTKSAALASGTAPLRRGAVVHTVDYFWRDYIWCQDGGGLDVYEEFTGESMDWDDEQEGPASVFINDIFDEEFKKLAKDLHLDVGVLVA